MRNSILLLAAFSLALILHIFTAWVPVRSVAAIKQEVYKNRFSVGCSPALGTINFADSALTIPLLSGWGKYSMPVTHSNDSAHTYFQQGINMYYAFHIIEALASFEKAIRFDTSFAMAYWGKALAYGPNINDIGYTASPEALEAVRKAKGLSAHCTAFEKALMAAMQLRYTADTTQKRDYLNQLYATAMQQLYSHFPVNADAAALYADALMVQHPWDLYDRHYAPKPWTPNIVTVLEAAIKKFPLHPGACHYYIHAIEGSKHPQKGLAVANRLGAMMPGLAHLVHMPSHIYIRTGNYSRGVQVNDDAVKGYYSYLSSFPPVVNNGFLYLLHNLHMQAASAGMGGMYAASIKYAALTQSNTDTSLLHAGGYFGVYAQYLYTTPLFTLIRFGKWPAVLKTPVLPASEVYAAAMGHFARAMAFARLHQPAAALQEFQLLQNNQQDPQLQESPVAFNPGIKAVQLATKIITGVMAEESLQPAIAITAFKEAVAMEDGMLYNEPRDWLLPARQYLGNALLKAGQFNEAENIFREDLAINPNNCWSLTGLSSALQKQGKRNQQLQNDRLLKKALKETDVTITSAVF